jgi:hypothetical protein
VYKSLAVLESPLTDVSPILECIHVRADNFLNYIIQLYISYRDFILLYLMPAYTQNAT